MTFKEKVVKLRKLKGLTQDEFASAVGVSRQAVYKWESGQSYPEVAKLLEMKILFNISIDDLLDDNYDVVVPEKKKKKISREIKKEIEAATVSDTIVAIEENVPVTSAEEAPVVEEAVVVEEETVVASLQEESPVIDAADDDKEEKKVGFFGRLFGRK